MIGYLDPDIVNQCFGDYPNPPFRMEDNFIKLPKIEITEQILKTDLDERFERIEVLIEKFDGNNLESLLLAATYVGSAITINSAREEYLKSKKSKLKVLKE